MMTRRGFLQSLGLIGAAAVVRVKPQPGRAVYEVGRGKEFASIQDALDQMWCDQGSIPFDADKTIAIHPGYYRKPERIQAIDVGEHRLVILGAGTCTIVPDSTLRAYQQSVGRGDAWDSDVD
jgi:hypothetical protein